jgi:hypothetical protein
LPVDQGKHQLMDALAAIGVGHGTEKPLDM